MTWKTLSEDSRDTIGSTSHHSIVRQVEVKSEYLNTCVAHYLCDGWHLSAILYNENGYYVVLFTSYSTREHYWM